MIDVKSPSRSLLCPRCGTKYSKVREFVVRRGTGQEMPMWVRFVVFVLCGFTFVAAKSSSSTSQKGRFLLRITETNVSMRPTAGPNTVLNCLVVTQDGRAHLELRRQEFFNGRATLATYEGILNATALNVLRHLIDAAAVRSLPSFLQPTTPMAVDSFHVITGKISRGAGLQQIGYFEWQGEAPKNAASAQQNWSQSAATMKPLVTWFRSLKATYPWKRVSNPKSGVCGES